MSEIVYTVRDINHITNLRKVLDYSFHYKSSLNHSGCNDFII